MTTTLETTRSPALLPAARRAVRVARRGWFGTALCTMLCTAFCIALATGLALTLAGCSDGSDGSPGIPGEPAPPPPTDTTLTKFEDAPGVNPVITRVTGQTGPLGTFLPGDTLTVEFTLRKDDGQAWDIKELGSDNIFVSGPTFNYQYVIGRKTDLDSASKYLGDGKYRYTFADPIPDVYMDYENNDGPYDPDEGELAGQPLLAGTYTVGMYLRFAYTVDGNAYVDVGNAVFDFLLGNSTTIQAHEVVTAANCNQCHTDLQAHGGQRKEPKLCAMCHVAGEVDESADAISVDFKVMIHKLHNAAHLPSVLGVATNDDGSRNYAATPKPYVLDGFNAVDFSEVEFPVWPNLSNPMPRDFGYTALTAGQKSLEDTIRSGVTDCDKCHGDPDGSGVLPAPADGDLYHLQPGKAACGSCHDDIDWTKPYVANQDDMQVSDYDSACNSCHTSTGSSLSVVDAHVHPMVDPDFNTGLNFVVSDVSRASPADGSAAFQAGDRVAVTFTLENDDGTPVDPADLATSISIVMAGPTTNSTLLMYTNFDKAAITGSPPYTVNLPELVWLERVGPGSGAAGETFSTSRSPHWHDVGSATSVRTVTGKTGAASTLTAGAQVRQNYLDVDDGDEFANGDYVVIDDGGSNEEYMRIQSVDDDRLWFASLYQSNFPPSLRLDHDGGESVEVVTTSAKLTPADFTVDSAAGSVTEVGNAFGTGEDILVTYTADFELPDVYTGAFNDSPDLDETWGDWSGKPLASGTYSVTLWSRLNLPLTLQGESQTYRALSPGMANDVLVGTATQIQPYDLISSAGNCYECHNDIYFHGNGRRGVETCLACHGVAGAEDLPPYNNAAALPTTGVSVNFRQMLHKIHMGKELTNASTYTVIGFGAAQHTYEHVGFPAMPGGTQNCTTCHGSGNEAWFEPVNRDHPTDQTQPVREWRTVCSSCHDSDAAVAHVESQTASGVESCSVCHGEGAEFAVEVMHKPR
jgi:hypothetical protein